MIWYKRQPQFDNVNYVCNKYDYRRKG